MKNNLLNDRFAYYGDSPTPTHLHLCVYDSAGVKRMSSENPDEVLSEIGKGGKIWLQVHGLLDAGSIKRICDYFHISFLTTQDIQKFYNTVKEKGRIRATALRPFWVQTRQTNKKEGVSE